ncbi:hypothetical protein [Leptospira adleri]|nr:hypothetical protein [Leptospira adleri]
MDLKRFYALYYFALFYIVLLHILVYYFLLFYFQNRKIQWNSGSIFGFFL